MKNNPYNCTQTGNLFVGYEDLRQQLIKGFFNGHSFALLGGRRMGKSSLLFQLKQDLQKQPHDEVCFLPCEIDFQAFGAATPNQVFKQFYQQITVGLSAPPWQEAPSGNEYEHFLSSLTSIQENLEQKHGPAWIVILLLDELDCVAPYLGGSAFFSNLRNFLMASEFKSRFRLVATGVKDMYDLIQSGSPLNNLRQKSLHRWRSSPFSTERRLSNYGRLVWRFTLSHHASLSRFRRSSSGQGLLLIDEVDLHLHPTWQRKLRS